jgi:hypothetical protein
MRAPRRAAWQRARLLAACVAVCVARLCAGQASSEGGSANGGGSGGSGSGGAAVAPAAAAAYHWTGQVSANATNSTHMTAAQQYFAESAIKLPAAPVLGKRKRFHGGKNLTVAGIAGELRQMPGLAALDPNAVCNDGRRVALCGRRAGGGRAARRAHGQHSSGDAICV